MLNLVNSNFNRTYNPSGGQNALSEIKRLLTSRDTEAQTKACGYLTEVIDPNSAQLVKYLLNNDITVFLCEATSNLDFSLFRSILTCLRLLWRERSFFAEGHAAHAMTAVLRALAHYTGSGSHVAVEACLHFLCDLLNGIAFYETTPPLSHQSAYSAVQLLACLNKLAHRICTNQGTILCSALVLQTLISYQPDSLTVQGSTAAALLEVLNQWFGLLTSALNHSMLVGKGDSGTILMIICQIGIDGLRLIKLLYHGKQKTDFVQSILVDAQEIDELKKCAVEIRNSIHRVISELISFTKDNQNQISTEEYFVFLKFLLDFLNDNGKSEAMGHFCDTLFSKGYLTMLPQIHIVRKDVRVRKVSTLVLGEMLKVLAARHLVDSELDDGACARDIHMGLVELLNGIADTQTIGKRLQRHRPHSLLIYLYFYCQSSENPKEVTAPLLPHLVELILELPRTHQPPPPYIVKAVWLIFAMSSISNDSINSLEARVRLEQATERLAALLQPEPSAHYTHHPALLLWALSSQRIPNVVRLHVLSQWLQTETSVPDNLAAEPVVWELLLSILVQCEDGTTAENCMEALYTCLGSGAGDEKEGFASLVWSKLPGVLSKALIDCHREMNKNICYLLDIATSLLPEDLDQDICLKIAMLITAIFSKNAETSTEGTESRHHYEYVCLKLCLCLLGMASNQGDSSVLLTYCNRPGFLPSVVMATTSEDDRVACGSLQLLSYTVHYYTRNGYQPKSILEIQTQLIIKSFRRDSSSERGAALLQLVYTVLNCAPNAPLALSHETGEVAANTQQCNALRALMLRVELMLCCGESKNRSLAGWKTLSSIFKHAIVSKNDARLIAILISQPMTHILIQFQLTQSISEEFLTFTHNWLSLLNITIKKNLEGKRSPLMAKESMVMKTLLMVKKSMVLEGDFLDVKRSIVGIIKDLMDGYSFVRLNQQLTAKG